MTQLETLQADLLEYDKKKKELEQKKEVEEKEMLEKLHNLENLYESN